MTLWTHLLVETAIILGVATPTSASFAIALDAFSPGSADSTNNADSHPQRTGQLVNERTSPGEVSCDQPNQAPARSKKQYLSSNPRLHPKREMSWWDYDRHSKRVGHFDPLVDLEWFHSSRGSDTQTSAWDVVDRDVSARDALGVNPEKPVQMPVLRQGTVLQHGQPHPGVPLASLTDEEESRRQTLLSLGGMLTFNLVHDDHFDLAWPDKRDEGSSVQQNVSVVNASIAAVSVLDGGQRMYADKIIWQPTSASSLPSELKRRRKDDEDEAADEDVEQSGRGRGHSGNGDDGGGRKSYMSGEDEDASRTSRNNRYGDDEDAPRDRKAKSNTELNGDRYEEDDLAGDLQRDSRGKAKMQDEEEFGQDDGQYPSQTDTLADSWTKGEDDGDDGEGRYAADGDASDRDKSSSANRPKKQAYDDGQYHPHKSLADNCAALDNFHQSMEGDSWTSHSDWRDQLRNRAGCCDWTGVMCDQYDRVIAVNLAGVGLHGELAGDLFDLDELVRLDVANNSLTLLPDRFASLAMLANFNASHNALSGAIPPSLLSHNMLKTLNLASIGLTGEIQVDSVNITSLALARNHLSGISVIEGRNLVKLDLSENAFQGHLPDLSQSLGLEILDVSFNNFTGPLLDMSRLTSLTRLDVRSNGLSGPFPATFRHLTRLTSLYLSSNTLTGPVPSEPAPQSLRSCYVMPNAISPCPSEIELAHPESLASRCHVRCPVNVDPNKPAELPVSPLPGEAGQPFNLALPPGSPPSTPPLSGSGAITPQSPGPAMLNAPPAAAARSEIGTNLDIGSSGMNASPQAGGGQMTGNNVGMKVSATGGRAVPDLSLPVRTVLLMILVLFTCL